MSLPPTPRGLLIAALCAAAYACGEEAGDKDASTVYFVDTGDTGQGAADTEPADVVSADAGAVSDVDAKPLDSSATVADSEVADVIDAGAVDAPVDAFVWPDWPAPDGPDCKSDADCANLWARTRCAIPHGKCVQCLSHDHCVTTTGFCDQWFCKAFKCKPGETHCASGFLQTCNAAGDGLKATACPTAKPFCVGKSCRLCEPSTPYCAPIAAGAKASKEVMKCAADGSSAKVHQACAAGEMCLAGACRVCVPGQKRCAKGVAQVCAAAGDKWESGTDCAAKGLNCMLGLCVSPCGSDFKVNSHVGCEYWAVDLDNFKSGGSASSDAQSTQFAVIVSNTSSLQATVKVTLQPDITNPGVKESASYSVAPGKVQVLNLPPKSWGLPHQSQDGSNVNTRAYKIESSQPIVAYQFNPLANVGVYSNDASLLLPSHVHGKVYYAMAAAHLSSNQRGTITVVASAPGKTKVTMTPTMATLGGSGVPAMTGGTTHSFQLSQGEVLNVESAGTPLLPGQNAASLTGTRILADKPIAVFGGHECGIVPSWGSCATGANGLKMCTGLLSKPCTKDTDCSANCCCDHLEEQLFPVKVWGNEYVVARFKARGGEKDHVRIVASVDKTKVVLTPSPLGGAQVPELNTGDVFKFATKHDVVIKSTEPIEVGHYMAPSFETSGTYKAKSYCTSTAQCKALHPDFGVTCETTVGGFSKLCMPIGDPALMMAVPTERYLDEYVFLVPDKYVSNYISVVAPKAQQVKVDGAAVPLASFKAVGSTGWTVATVEVQPGTHVVTAGKPVGVFVYGYDAAVSYAYAAGAKF